MTDLTVPPPMPEPVGIEPASIGRNSVVYGNGYTASHLRARDAIWAERVESLQAKLQGDPAVPVVAQRMWIEGSDESNLGWWELQDVDCAEPLHEGYEPLVRQADHAAAIASLQTRLDAAERDAARLEWLLHKISGKALRDVGLVVPEGGLEAGRAAIDSATQEKP